MRSLDSRAEAEPVSRAIAIRKVFWLCVGAHANQGADP